MVVSIVNQNFGRQVAETYRKQETVVNFDTTSRRGGSEVREDYCFIILKKNPTFANLCMSNRFKHNSYHV